MRFGAVVAVAAAAALVIWLVVRGGEEPPPPPQRATPQAVSVADLRALPASVGHPVYWAGEEPGTQLELSQTRDGSIYIRYLPEGARLGDPRPNFLTVGTYPGSHAIDAVRKAAKRSDATIQRVPGGGLAFANPQYSGSVFLAFPHSQYEIEVYDPSQHRALKLVKSGRIRALR